MRKLRRLLPWNRTDCDHCNKILRRSFRIGWESLWDLRRHTTRTQLADNHRERMKHRRAAHDHGHG